MDKNIRPNEGLSYKKGRSPEEKRRAAVKEEHKKPKLDFLAYIKQVKAKAKSIFYDEKGFPNFKNIGILFASVLLLIIIVPVIFSLSSKEKPVDTKAGVAYIKQLESKDISELETTINKAKKQKRLEALRNGTGSVWAQFSNSVIMGDSRAVGFYYFGFTDESRTLAIAGATILEIENNLETLKQLQPDNIFLCYGLNDMSIGIWDTSDEYCAEFERIIGELRETCPNSDIYINSILRAIDPAFELSTKWYERPEWNTAISAMCEKLNIPFIDNEDLCLQYENYWEGDGIHVQSPFYEPWALNMIMAVMDNESE